MLSGFFSSDGERFENSWVNKDVNKSNFFDDEEKGFKLELPKGSKFMETRIRADKKIMDVISKDIDVKVKGVFRGKDRVKKVDTHFVFRNNQVLSKIEKEYICSSFVNKEFEGKDIRNLFEVSRCESDKSFGKKYRDKVGRKIRDDFDKMKLEWGNRKESCSEEVKDPMKERIIEEMQRVEKFLEVAGHD